MGPLETSSATFVLNENFTQDDIDAERILYVHNGSVTTSDSFNFTVADLEFTLPEETFEIEIAILNSAPDGISLSNTVIPETSSAGALIGTLSTSDIDATDSHSYEILSGGTNFEILNVNRLHLINPLQPDSYEVEIQSTDMASESVTATFTITVKAVGVDAIENDGIVSFGTTTENFRMISIPLASASVSSVFPLLQAADFGATWKVVQYSNGTNSDLNRNSNLVAGKGYWFLSFDKTTITLPDNGNPVSPNADGEFNITLQSGWNIIGNPFFENVDIAAAIAKGISETDFTVDQLENAGSIYKYNGTYSTSDQTLMPFEGAWIEVNSTITLGVPSPTLSPESGRSEGFPEYLTRHDSHFKNQDEWQLLLKVDDGQFSSDLAGIGMRSEALDNKDFYDIGHPPTISGDLIFRLLEKGTGLARSIVTNQDGFLWEYDFHSRRPNTILSWDMSVARMISNELYLLIPSQNKFINMKTIGSLKLEGIKNIQIVYGNEVNQKINGIYANLYPNPTDGDLTLEILNFGSEHPEDLEFELFNLNGRLEYRSPIQLVSSTAELSLKGLGLASGVYFYRIKGEKVTTATQKLVIR